MCLHTGNTCMLLSVASVLAFQTMAPPEVCRRADQAEVEEIQRRVFLKVYITQTPQWSKNTVIVEVCSVRFCQNTRRQMAKLHRNTLASSVCVCVFWGESFACSLLCRCVFETEGNFHIYHCACVCMCVRVCTQTSQLRLFPSLAELKRRSLGWY